MFNFRWKYSGVAVATMLGLAALPNSASAQAANGAKIYGTICAACHQATGKGIPGMFPPLSGSEWVSGNKDQVIKIVLHGLTGPITVEGEEYNSTMPPFGAALKDAELAAVTTYVRSNFGNKAPAVTAADVARVRKATVARKKPWTIKELVASSEAKK